MDNYCPSNPNLIFQTRSQRGINPEGWEDPAEVYADPAKIDGPKLIALGLDPKDYVQPEPFNPRTAKYQILVDDGKETFYSKKEPTPYGSGFRFISLIGNKELTISGNVKIVKLEQ